MLAGPPPACFGRSADVEVGRNNRRAARCKLCHERLSSEREAETPPSGSEHAFSFEHARDVAPLPDLAMEQQMSLAQDRGPALELVGLELLLGTQAGFGNGSRS